METRYQVPYIFQPDFSNKDAVFQPGLDVCQGHSHGNKGFTGPLVKRYRAIVDLSGPHRHPELIRPGPVFKVMVRVNLVAGPVRALQAPAVEQGQFLEDVLMPVVFVGAYPAQDIALLRMGQVCNIIDP